MTRCGRSLRLKMVLCFTSGGRPSWRRNDKIWDLRSARFTSEISSHVNLCCLSGRCATKCILQPTSARRHYDKPAACRHAQKQTGQAPVRCITHVQSEQGLPMPMPRLVTYQSSDQSSETIHQGFRFRSFTLYTLFFNACAGGRMQQMVLSSWRALAPTVGDFLGAPLIHISLWVTNQLSGHYKALIETDERCRPASNSFWKWDRS